MKEAPKKPKCLHITTIDLTAYCFLRTWFTYLREHGFDVTLSTTVQQFRKELEETGARVVDIPISRSANPVSDFISLIKLMSFIKKEKFDSVHTYTTKAGFVGRLAAKLSGVPIIVHTIFELPQNSARNPLLKFAYKKMEQLAALWADHFITISTFNQKQISDERILNTSKLDLIPEGLVTENYEAVNNSVPDKKKELGIPENAFVIGTVARLEAAKGYPYLLEAAKKILETKKTHDNRDIYFVAVGKGRMQPQLEEKAKELGISDRMIFTGFRDDMWEILRTFDIFALPSIWEGQGVVLLEAMCYSKPVVASDVGGITDVVDDGVTGILIPPADPEALAAALIKMMDNPDMMKKMGDAGYERVNKLFHDRDSNRKRLEVYKKLYKNRLGITID
ncbi:MAG: glycosyltransferase family 4 protein [Firmicutes bacterium]|nr:glycosyltransferase family 4 protein [Bacillota bacterium]